MLERVYGLMQKDIKPDSEDSDELEILSILIKEYENEHYPVPQPNPLEAIKFRPDQMNLSETIAPARLHRVVSWFLNELETINFKKNTISLLLPRGKRIASCGKK